MRKWIVEDWAFTLTVTEGKAENCRLGFEAGDTFTFSYACPDGVMHGQMLLKRQYKS